MNLVYYIIYTSTPTAPPTKAVIDEILKDSRSSNEKKGITGMLLCTQDRYFQFLEGDEQEVNAVFDKIKKDPRHTGVYVRIRGFNHRRIFEEWSMASWMLSKEELSHLSGLQDLRSYMRIPYNETFSHKKFMGMMQNILEIWLTHSPEASSGRKG